MVDTFLLSQLDNVDSARIRGGKGQKGVYNQQDSVLVHLNKELSSPQQSVMHTWARGIAQWCSARLVSVKS